MPSQSLFRQPGVQHFQLLHRSLRDPLVNSEEREFAPIDKGKGRANQENVLQALEHGITFDDVDSYDYAQHLRPIGADREAIFVETTTQQQAKQWKEERTYADFMGLPEKSYGLEPDMDPALRQVLEALDDDAFQDTQADGDLDQLLESGERWDQEDADWEDEMEETAYDKEMAKYRKNPRLHDSDDEELDELGSMPGFPKSKKAAGAKNSVSGSAFSMSSSAMRRNQGLQDLDHQFDEIEKEYEEDSEQEDASDDEQPDLSKQRSDLDSILNDFLAKQDVLGKRLEPSIAALLASEPSAITPLDQLAALRKQLRDIDLGASAQENKARILARAKQITDTDGKQRRADDLVDWAGEPAKDRWDCETVLSTYSNLENHPKMLRLARKAQAKSETKIEVDRDGFPVVKTLAPAPIEVAEDSDDSNETATVDVIKRPANESAEEKKLRKQAIKQQQAARRSEKKATKDAFRTERLKQTAVISKHNRQDLNPAKPAFGVKTVSLS